MKLITGKLTGVKFLEEKKYFKTFDLKIFCIKLILLHKFKFLEMSFSQTKIKK